MGRRGAGSPGGIVTPKVRQKVCPHLEDAQPVTALSEGCEQCIALGDSWVHLRVCVICGQVGCCDQSKNKHATKHYHETGHPTIRSFEPGETWMYCYEDEVFMQPG